MSRVPDTTQQEAPSTRAKDTGSTPKTVSARIKGKVQGVYYRKWTLQNALKLGLNGWVRNRKDGSVEAVFSGHKDSVDTMLEKCKTGSAAARVSAIEMSTWTEPVAAGFERLPTL